MDPLPKRLRLLALLRRDVTAPDPNSADPEARIRFLTWWRLHGEDEYPALASSLSLEERMAYLEWLGSDAPGIIQDAGAPITRSMHGVWLLRDDLRRVFDIAAPEGRQALLRWCRADGQIEYPDRLLNLAPHTVSEPVTTEARTGDASLQPMVTLVGFARGEFGIGEDVRMAAASLSAAGIPYEVYSLPSQAHRDADHRLDPWLSIRPQGCVNLFCITGFDTADLFLRHPEIFSGRYNIGYWPWELSEWPDEWVDAFGLVDELWASTRFIGDAMSLKSPVPVVHMPMAVTVETASALSRASFGLAEGWFQFLYVFDWNSYSARKNPFAAIEAFRAAFPDPGQPTGLVLKTMGLDESSPEGARLISMVRQDGRITLINTTLDRAALLRLTALCDSVVSLHRSEGFGRTLAEAMLLGRPVIATDYSGNTDFCWPSTCAMVPASLIPVGPDDYPNARGQVWADPSLQAAALAMRRVASDPEYRDEIASAGQALVRQRHDPAAVGARYRERLAALRLTPFPLSPRPISG